MMSDTKYNFDDYIFDNVLEDTYLAIKDVRENIDRWVKETREIDFDYNPYMSLSDKTQETIDKVCENFEWNETKSIEVRFADVVAQEGRKHIDVSEAENILDVPMLPRFVRPRYARRPCPSGLVHRASSMSPCYHGLPVHAMLDVLALRG